MRKLTYLAILLGILIVFIIIFFLIKKLTKPPELPSTLPTPQMQINQDQTQEQSNLIEEPLQQQAPEVTEQKNIEVKSTKVILTQEGFSPKNLKFKVGDEVEIIVENKTNSLHFLTWDVNELKNQTSANGPLEPNVAKTFKVKFNQKGVFKFYCYLPSHFTDLNSGQGEVIQFNIE